VKARFERWARTVIAALALTWPLEHAWADGLELDIANPRAIGRAGAVWPSGGMALGGMTRYLACTWFPGPASRIQE
jgi:hypothetical protein